MLRDQWLVNYKELEINTKIIIQSKTKDFYIQKNKILNY